MHYPGVGNGGANESAALRSKCQTKDNQRALNWSWERRQCGGTIPAARKTRPTRPPVSAYRCEARTNVGSVGGSESPLQSRAGSLTVNSEHRAAIRNVPEVPDTVSRHFRLRPAYAPAMGIASPPQHSYLPSITPWATLCPPDAFRGMTIVSPSPISSRNLRTWFR